MTRTTLNYVSTQNLNAYDRTSSAILGIVMIGSAFTLASGSSLGWMALLPILGIYPCFAAITGYSPIRAALHAIAKRIKRGRSRFHSEQPRQIGMLSH